jgi:hypothetical protein
MKRLLVSPGEPSKTSLEFYADSFIPSLAGSFSLSGRALLLGRAYFD